MAGPFTTPVAFSTPFLSDPERANGFVSKNAQEAIEEALALAISNDRFLVFSKYTGNANVGRFLEFYNGISSDDAPLVFGISPSSVLAVVSSTTSASSTALIGFYDINTDPTFLSPLYTLDMDNNKRKIDTGDPLFTVPANALLAIKVDQNSIQKPHLQIILNSQSVVIF